jgi:hypothetical protein
VKGKKIVNKVKNIFVEASIINGRYGYYRERRLMHENRGKRESDK